MLNLKTAKALGLRTRREFITMIAGAAAVWPRAARAQDANFQERFSPVEPLLTPNEPAAGRPSAGRGPEERFEISGSHVVIADAKLRKAPSAKSVTSIVLKAGSPVQVIAVTNEWAQIKYESSGILLEGYVRARELRTIQ